MCPLAFGKDQEKKKTTSKQNPEIQGQFQNLTFLEELIQQQLYLFHLSNYHIIKCMNYKRAKALN